MSREYFGYKLIKPLYSPNPQLETFLATKDEEMFLLKCSIDLDSAHYLNTEFKKFMLFNMVEDKIKELLPTDPAYNLLFAKTVLSRTSVEDGCRVNIYTLTDMDYEDLSLLSELATNVFINARTCVWIIGRLFKLYSFYELAARENEEFSDTNRYIIDFPAFNPQEYFVSTKHHRLVYYHFGESKRFTVANEYVKDITNFMLNWTDFSNDDYDQGYKKLLQDFAENGRESFFEAHTELYDYVKETWGKGYYPFTYRGENMSYWVSITE